MDGDRATLEACDLAALISELWRRNQIRPLRLNDASSACAEDTTPTMIENVRVPRTSQIGELLDER